MSSSITPRIIVIQCDAPGCTVRLESRGGTVSILRRVAKLVGVDLAGVIGSAS